MTGLPPVTRARRRALRHAPEAIEALLACIREPDPKLARWATKTRACALILEAGGLIRQPPDLPPDARTKDE